MTTRNTLDREQVILALANTRKQLLDAGVPTWRLPEDSGKWNLGGADLRGVHLEKAPLHAARMNGADLRGAYFTEVDLSHAELQGADLRGMLIALCDMTRADL